MAEQFYNFSLAHTFHLLWSLSSSNNHAVHPMDKKMQIWLAMSDGTLLDCCYCKAYGGRKGAGRSGSSSGGGGEGVGGGLPAAVGRSGSGGSDDEVGEGDERRSTGCVLFCNPNAGYYESMVLAGEGGRNW